MQHLRTKQNSAAVRQGQRPSPTKGRYRRCQHWKTPTRERRTAPSSEDGTWTLTYRELFRFENRTRRECEQWDHIATTQEHRQNEKHFEAAVVSHTSTRRVVQQFKNTQNTSQPFTSSRNALKLHANFGKYGRNSFDVGRKRRPESDATRRKIGPYGAVLHSPPGFGVTGDGKTDAHRSRVHSFSFVTCLCDSRDPASKGSLDTQSTEHTDFTHTVCCTQHAGVDQFSSEVLEYPRGALIRQWLSEDESHSTLTYLQRTDITLYERTHHEATLTLCIQSARTPVVVVLT